MFGILLSAFNAVLAFVLRSVLVKFFTFFALYFVVTGFLQVMQSAGLFPSASSLNGALAGIPSAVAYFMDMFAVSQGISMMVSAYFTRFIIRRIPIIG